MEDYLMDRGLSGRIVRAFDEIDKPDIKEIVLEGGG